MRVIPIPQSRDFIVVRKKGLLTKFSWDRPGVTLDILDMQDITWSSGEAGFLDIAFHPQFDNVQSEHFREMYLSYNYMYNEDATQGYVRLSKFKVADDLRAVLPASEEILIQQFDQNPNHNAGELFFDEEEYLYITLGDEGGHWDQYANAQRIHRELFSGVLRIDVNNDSTRSHPIRRHPQVSVGIPPTYPKTFTQGYMIPDDNPWVDESGANLEEFYAIGLRNPFSAYYDSETQQIWVGDVGQDAQEELNILTRGSNAAWPYMEGLIQHEDKPSQLLGEETSPAFAYGRNLGRSVICGFVYRGDDFPELKNSMIFGDFMNGNVWRYSLDKQEAQMIAWGHPQLVHYFEGPDGNICAISFTGQIHELTQSEGSPIPQLLSQTGAFRDLQRMEPNEGIVPYEINAPLWSDSAAKKRWIAIPRDQKVGYQRDDSWVFSEGTVLIKHFEMPIGPDTVKRLETRFVIKNPGEAYGLTYRWNNDDTDAVLIGATEEIADTLELLDGSSVVWNYPTRSQCFQCHTGAAGFMLGVKSAQLNRSMTMNGQHYDSQLDLWNELRLFNQIYDISDAPKMSGLGDPNATALNKFKSYLDANCAQCHRPDGVAPQFDARYSTRLQDQGMVFKESVGFNSLEDGYIINPGDTATSELWRRDASLAEGWKMPPLAKNKLDLEYLEFLQKFIHDLESPREYIQDTICLGDSYAFSDSTSAVMRTDLLDSITFRSSLGLDSVVVWDLKVVAPDTTVVSDTICYGGSYTFPSGQHVRGITMSAVDTSFFLTSLNRCTMLISKLTVRESMAPCADDTNISIGPNPVQGSTFYLYSDADISSVVLADFAGNLIPISVSEMLETRAFSVRLPEHLASGVYVIRVQTAGDSWSSKVIVP